MNWIQKIIGCFEYGTLFYSKHARFEMENEEFGRIFDKDVYEAPFIVVRLLKNTFKANLIQAF